MKAPQGVGAAELQTLCAAVIAAILVHRVDVALAYAWLSLARNNSDRFKQLARFALSMGSVTLENQFAALQRIDWWSIEHPASVLLELVSPCPIVLIRFLDHLLADAELGPSTEEAPDLFDERLYTGSVGVVELDLGRLTSLGLQVVQSRAYVLRRKHTGEPPPAAERQLPDLNRFNPNWYVVLEIPDLNHPNRRILSCPPTPGLRAACADIEARAQRQLRVYLAELACKPYFDSVILENELSSKAWIAQGLFNEREVLDEALAHLHRAQELNVDVVVFPELTVPPAVRDAVADWMTDSNGKKPGRHSIGLVIAGSFHCSDDAEGDAIYNTAFAVDRSGHSIPDFAHRKITSVSLGGHALIEGNMSGSVIRLVHTPLGIQSVVICLDLAQAIETDKLALDRLPIRWLWVPSLSEKVNAHVRRAHALNLHHLTRIACANQGEAQCTPEVTLAGTPLQSFVVVPGKSQSVALNPNVSGTYWKVFDTTI